MDFVNISFLRTDSILRLKLLYMNQFSTFEGSICEKVHLKYQLTEKLMWKRDIAFCDDLDNILCNL